MKRTTYFGLPLRAAVILGLCVCAFAAQAAGIDVHGFILQNPVLLSGVPAFAMVGEIDGAAIMKALESVETKMAVISEKSAAEMKDLGKVSTDTKTAIENIGIEQRTLADRLLQIEQKSTATKEDTAADESVGTLFVKNAVHEQFKQSRGAMRVTAEVKNTVTNAIGNTYSDRRPGLVEGASRVFTLEQLLTSIPTSSNAIDYIRETVFTNAAAETAEGTTKPQSSITTEQKTMPVVSIAHWVKITRQLAMDNAALAAYINRRMMYGVSLRKENQIVAGSGVGQSLSGFTAAGNFTAHGYTSASLTALNLSPTNRFDLIGKMLGDCALADYPADVVLLNTGDWWTLRLAKDSTGRYLLGDPSLNIPPMIFGVPVVATNAMVAGSVWVGSLAQAATLHPRENVIISLSDSDGDNFVNGIITILADCRLALTVEKPAACRYGLLLPA
jgi:HK97 family phage major capsid protein